jgi:transcription termination/antitermination protein NusA
VNKLREFDMKTIQIINAFEEITGTEVRDCIPCEEKIYFLVNEGKAALAIGKGGKRVQTAEQLLGKQIRVLEFNENIEKFIKSLIPMADKIEIRGNVANVTVNGKKRGAVIGKGGENIKILRDILSRNSELEDLKVV